MRNWYTSLLETGVTITCALSDITYEELIHKQEFPAGICPVNTRRTLPMRNWYLSILQHELLYFLCILLWSDITYEELILSSICREKAFPKSDITYEELIHASSASDGWVMFSASSSRTLPMRNWYIPILLMHICTSINGRTLPMRNWYLLHMFFYQLHISS